MQILRQGAFRGQHRLARCVGPRRIEAQRLGFTQVRLIHGRGIGVQRERIRSLLRELDFILDFEDADPSGGGWGSTVVLLAEANRH